MIDQTEFKSISFDLKAVETDNPNGEFEAILSTSDVDREGETVAPGAFNPLPKSIPIHFDHDFLDKVPPVGRGEPFYDGETLKVRGFFASTTRAQELRSLVNEGVIDSMSAGFITMKRKGKAVLQGDLVEGSLTATPINRGAVMVRSKALESLKAGARNSSTDADRLQQIHDLAVSNGADCTATKSIETAPERVTTKAIAGSYEERQEDILEAVVDANQDELRRLYPDSGPGDDQWRVSIIATFDDRVVYRLSYDEDAAYQSTYTWDGETVTLGAAEAVEVEQVVTPTASPDNSKTASSDATPETPAAAAPTAKSVGAAAVESPADAEDMDALRTTYELLSNTA